MIDWTAFLEAARDADLAPAFEQDDRPSITVDGPPLPGPGHLALNRKGGSPGAPWAPSALSLVLASELPPGFEAQPRLTGGLDELAERHRLVVEDASPDSLCAVLILAARLSGVEVPPEIGRRWLPVIDLWEGEGLAGDPERSWPVLASALVHRLFGSSRVLLGRVDQLRTGWDDGMRFCAETMLAGHDPAGIPDEAHGVMLDRARGAFEAEMAWYQGAVEGSRLIQLSLPVADAPGRRRVVDAILTSEEELTGALKVVLRNDRRNAPLGHGFDFMLLERPGLREETPSNWMTASLDMRAGLHLRDLWSELERLETEAWREKGRERPSFREGVSRHLPHMGQHPQPFHQHWYIDPDFGLVASPHSQAAPGATSEEEREAPGSLLDADAVEEAVCRVYDPLKDRPVGSTSGPAAWNLATVAPHEENAPKRRLSAVWPASAPLPSAASPAAWHGLFPTAIQAMGARTLGHAPHRAILDAPPMEDLETAAFPGGFAVLSDEGAFLLNSGRGRHNSLRSAEGVVDEMGRLGAELDILQRRLGELGSTFERTVSGQVGAGAVRDFARRCAALQADLTRAASASAAAGGRCAPGLRPLRDAISRRWGVRERVRGMREELDALRGASQMMEETRVVRVAGWAALIGGALLVADVLGGPLAEAVGTGSELIWTLGLFVVSVPAIALGSRLLRSRTDHRAQFSACSYNPQSPDRGRAIPKD